MGRRFLAFVCLLLCAASLAAQAVDAKMCDILVHPSSYDGKLVRITGTVIAGLDEFVVKDPACGLPINAIWLAYPEGTKAKSGPAVAVYVQLAINSPTKLPAMQRAPVALDANKDFKQFDAALSASPKASGRCLGCVRSTVTATLTGRLDGVDNPGLERDGKLFTAVRGFGNLSRYPARLVLQSVSNVTATEIDYSKPAPPGDGNVELQLGADQQQRAVAAFGAEGEQNGVELSFGSPAVLGKNDGGKGAAISPDGLFFNVVFGSDQLKGPALSEAMAHAGTHIADLREHAAPRTLYQLEARAWSVTLITAVSLKEKTLTGPGGYQLWNSGWSDADRQRSIPGAISGLVADWEALGR